jgi:hypothetical protein
LLIFNTTLSEDDEEKTKYKVNHGAVLKPMDTLMRGGPYYIWTLLLENMSSGKRSLFCLNKRKKG